jgi:uncharacterized Fe-S cluster protein YjdI
MARKTYSGRDVDVSFDPEVCIHAGACVKGLPAVFDTRRRPWIEPDNAGAAEVIAQVVRCPSGALRIERPAREHPREPEHEDHQPDVRP